MKTPTGEMPTIEQAIKGVTMLEGKSPFVWRKFMLDYSNHLNRLLEDKEGIPLSEKLLTRSTILNVEIVACHYLRRFADSIPAEVQSSIEEHLTQKIALLDEMSEEGSLKDDYALYREDLRALYERLQITPEQKVQAAQTLSRIAHIDESEIESIQTREDFTLLFNGLGRALTIKLLTHEDIEARTFYRENKEGEDEVSGFGLMLSKWDDKKMDSPIRKAVILVRRKDGYLNFGLDEYARTPEGKYAPSNEIFYYTDIPIDRPLTPADFKDTDTPDQELTKERLQNIARDTQNDLKTFLSFFK